MLSILQKTIELSFYLIFFLVPLVFLPQTSELFEFNKIIVTYILTVVITTAWLAKSIIKGRVIFRRTLLDIPLLIFIFFQVISTIFSIDQRTSLLGYYSRFNGGLLSTLSYSFLFWAYVSNMDKKSTRNVLYAAFASAVLVSVWGIFEHFGRSFSCLLIPGYRAFDVSCWVQDVQNRVFATLGQPNWLAAWLVALIPITWGFGLNSKKQTKNLRFWVNLVLSCLFFTTLLYTKSRSGIIAFAVTAGVFWFVSFLTLWKQELKRFTYPFFIFNFLVLVLASMIGTPWTPSLKEILSADSLTANSKKQASPGPALEVGGTESGEIRKIVWKGALNIWRTYPLFGSGVETFAYAYYSHRPVEHNLVSEWDYLYNKAHNEYLNFAATTGVVGLLSYLFLIACIIIVFLRNLKTNSDSQIDNGKLVNLSLLSGFIGILVTNSVGFSVVPTALCFFLFPAFAFTLQVSKNKESSGLDLSKLTLIRKTGLVTLSLTSLYLIFLILKYWRADYYFAQGRLESDAGNAVNARRLLGKAILLSPSEAVFWDELAKSGASIAVGLPGDEKELAENAANSAIFEAEKAIKLAPANVNFKRSFASTLIKLSALDINYLAQSQEVLKEALKGAPTDAKLYYNLALVYIRTGEVDKGIKTLEKTIELKPNYQEARYAYALILIDLNRKTEAKTQLEYILKNINPGNVEVKEELENL